MIHAFVTKKRERKDHMRIFSCPLHLLTDYITEEEAYAVVRIEMSGFRIRAFFFSSLCRERIAILGRIHNRTFFESSKIY